MGEKIVIPTSLKCDLSYYGIYSFYKYFDSNCKIGCDSTSYYTYRFEFW